MCTPTENPTSTLNSNLSAVEFLGALVCEALGEGDSTRYDWVHLLFSSSIVCLRCRDLELLGALG